MKAAEGVSHGSPFAGVRICFVVNADWFFLSHRLPLAEAVRAGGADVVIIAGENGKRAEIERRGFRFVRLPISRSGTNPLRDLRTLLSLWRSYRSLRPDLAYHVTLKPAIYGSLAARAARVPAVVNAITGLGYVFAREDRARPIRLVLGLLFRAALAGPRNLVIFQNPEDRRLFHEKGWASEERTAVVRGSGVDCERFSVCEEPSSPPFVVMLAARMLWDKGIGEFVEAARILRDRGHANTRFVLVGGTDEGNCAAVPREQLEAWVAEGVVEWRGYREDMPQVMAEAHIVTLPTKYGEGLPKVLLEAAACGRAIVATDVPGCREVVRDGVNGLLIPVRDEAALADALRVLLADAPLRRAMGRRSRSLAEAEFSLDRVTDETLSIYRSALHREP